MNVLMIGNSFSMDAERYLHRIARVGGDTINTCAPYIGGCSLERHWRDLLGEKKDYELLYNGERTGFYVSLNECLYNRSWDVIAFQQQSGASGHIETYMPYLCNIVEFVKKVQPNAKLYIHETWAYEDGCPRIKEAAGFESYEEMRENVISAYREAARMINADGIIPAGEMFGKMHDEGITDIHRDTYHASYGTGRYALGLVWYRTLTGKSVVGNTFRDFDAPVEEEKIELLQRLADTF